ncbi:MAG TPA: YHS domain-containing protein, partial [Terriglobales bacterium]
MGPFRILETTVKDPVCHMDVDPAKAAGSHQHDGTTYYFCSTHCLNKFRAAPQRYLAPEAAPEPMPAAAREYTCPMHPEVVRTEPGACPKCGMALEPKTLTLEEEANPELEDMSRRFWVSAALTLPIFVLAMFLDHALPWLQLALATPVVLWG